MINDVSMTLLEATVALREIPPNPCLTLMHLSSVMTETTETGRLGLFKS